MTLPHPAVRYNNDYQYTDDNGQVLFGAYQMIVDREEHATIEWLNDRGYDADLWKLSIIVTSDEAFNETDEDTDKAFFLRYDLLASLGRTFLERIAEDTTAYLTCNGSDSLADKLSALEALIERNNP
jgi:hypothetical protein